MKHLFIGALLLFALQIWAPSPTNASHLLGAETEWKYLGNDSFMIIVNAYRDCNGTSLSNTPIKITSSCGTKTLKTSMIKIGDVTPVCPGIVTRCSNPTSKFPYGYEQYQLYAYFDASVYRKNGCCKVTIDWEQCCRSSSITTGGANQNFVLNADFSICDPISSPTWNKPAVGIGCLGQEMKINNGVDNTNSCDSLVYTCASPKGLTWSINYSACEPVSFLGFPKAHLALPRGYHIDSITGLTQFKCMKTEVTIIPIKVELYNKGAYVGYMMRDMQLIVQQCASNSPPVLTGINLSDPRDPDNFRMTTCADKKMCIKMTASDNDRKDTVRINHYSNIKGLHVKTDSSQSIDVVNICWTPDSNDVSTFPHSLSLFAHDNNCPTPGTSSQIYKITVLKKFKYKLALKFIDVDKCGTYMLKVRDSLNRKLTNIKWFENDTIPLGSEAKQKVIFNTPGKRKITVVVDDCQSQSISAILNVKNPKMQVIANDTLVCNDQALEIMPKIINGKGGYTYKWTVGRAFKSITQLSDSNITIDLPSLSSYTTGLINYSVTDTLRQCTETGAIQVTSLPASTKNIYTGNHFCDGNIDSVVLPLDTVFGNWSGKALSNNTIHFNLLPPGSYLYSYKAIDKRSCTIDTATIVYGSLPKVDAGPDLSTCINDSITTLKGSPSGGYWQGTAVLAHTFNSQMAGKGNHQLIYYFEDSIGCQNSDTLTATVFDDIPVIIKSADTVSACYNGTAIISAKPTGGTWYGKGRVSSANPTTIKANDLGAGNFPFVYTYRNAHNCQASDTTFIHVENEINAKASLRDSSVKIKDSIIIINQTPDKNNYDFIWTSSKPQKPESHKTNYAIQADSLGWKHLIIKLVAINNTSNCSDTFLLDDSIKVVLGTAIGSGSSGDLNIYPNPAHETLTIVGKQNALGIVKIYNSSGQLVLSFNCNQSRATIKTETFPAGLYSLSLVT
ncbi:T9SS type A sorting domain-containing protein, partial [bacterium]|nr:T9SS type A sorting domain-containing protein [bacterium]